MEKMSNYHEFIQPFLDGELSREELDWISKELENNAVLAEDIRLYREIDSAIREQDVLELRSQLDTIHKSMDERITEPQRIPQYRKVLSYAAIASLAILLSLGVLFKTQNRKLSSDEIFQKYYEPYELTMVYRSAQTATNKLLQDAMIKYEAGQYQDALVLFEKVLEKDPGDMETNLYTGISYMETDQYSKAGNSFNRIIEQNDNLYIEQAEWYLGFCYMMTGRKDQAKDQFLNIAGSNSYYNKKALQIARRIK